MRESSKESMKTSIHVPVEQYGFVLVEEVDWARMREVYDHVKKQFQDGAGLPDKDFDQFIQAIIEDKPNQIEDLEKLSPEQHHLMQVVKRAMKRIGYHGRKELAEQEEHIKNIK